MNNLLIILMSKQVKLQAKPKPKPQKQKKATLKSSQGALYQAPLAQGRLFRGQNPSVSGSKYSGDGRTKFTHREFVSDVNGSVDYAVTGYPINPGLPNLFTWLSGEAVGFESYQFKKLWFEYETQKGAQTDGTIMMAIDYDASDSAPVNKTQLMSYHNSVRSAAWQECIFTAALSNLTKFGPQRYLRFGNIPANTDVKTYDIGNLFVATKGCADGSPIGELYVCYEVELITPQTDLDALSGMLSAKVVASTGVTDTAIFGTSPTITGGLAIAALGNTLTFNRVGQYLVTYSISGTGLGIATPATGGTTTSSFVVPIIADGGGLLSTCSVRVRVNEIGQTLIIDFSAATTITATTTRVSSYLYDLN